MTTTEPADHTDDLETDELELPPRKVWPLVVAAVVAGALGVVIGLLLIGGKDDDRGEPVTIGADVGLEPAEDVVGEAAPDTPVTYFDGTEGSLADFRGTPVVLNFFASWCPPCVEEMPELQAASLDYDGEVTFVGMNSADEPEDGLRTVEETGVTYPVARDESGELYVDLGALQMPTTYFLDADGDVVRMWTGAIDADELRAVIDQELLG